MVRLGNSMRSVWLNGNIGKLFAQSTVMQYAPVGGSMTLSIAIMVPWKQVVQQRRKGHNRISDSLYPINMQHACHDVHSVACPKHVQADIQCVTSTRAQIAVPTITPPLPFLSSPGVSKCLQPEWLRCLSYSQQVVAGPCQRCRKCCKGQSICRQADGGGAGVTSPLPSVLTPTDCYCCCCCSRAKEASREAER